METVHILVEEWLSACEGPTSASSNLKRPFAQPDDTISRKRRRLSDHPQHPRERSWSDGDAVLLSDLPPPPREKLIGAFRSSTRSAVPAMDLGVGAMGPPPTPSSSGRQRIRTLSQAESASAASYASSRATSDAITSSNYRQRVLKRNGILFRHEMEPLPDAIGRHLSQMVTRERAGPDLMSWADAEALSGELFNIDAEEEAQFLAALEHPGPLPEHKRAKSQFKGTTSCTRQRFFHDEVVPRSSPDLLFPKISRPRPDYAHGYDEQAFSLRQNSVLEKSRVYQVAGNMTCPFLIIEGKSQACGGNTWHASNQCAGGGSSCVKAALTLYHQQPDQTDGGLEAADCVAYSLAVDTALAVLYIHWAEGPSADQFFLQCVQQYLVRRPEDLIRLQTHLQNIIAWGMGPRLEKVKRSLDGILEGQGRLNKRTISELDTHH